MKISMTYFHTRYCRCVCPLSFGEKGFLKVSLPYLTLPYRTVPYLTLPYLTLPYLTLSYLTLPYLTLPYLTLPYLTWPYLTLHFLTLHYLTLRYPRNRTKASSTGSAKRPFAWRDCRTSLSHELMATMKKKRVLRYGYCTSFRPKHFWDVLQ